MKRCQDWPPSINHDLLGAINFRLRTRYVKYECFWYSVGWYDWHGAKGIWINRMLNSLYDLDIWSYPWPWLWICKVKFWNSFVSGMDGFDSFKFMNIKAVNNSVGTNENIYMYIYFSPSGGYPRLLCSLLDLVVWLFLIYSLIVAHWCDVTLELSQNCLTKEIPTFSFK